MAGFGQNKVRLSIRTLVLRHTWTTTMSSSTTRDTVHVEFEREGLIGYGEGAPIVRYGESALGALEALRGIVPLLAGGDPRQFTPWLAQIREALGPRQHAALSAVETAVCDWLGKRLGISLFEWFGLDPAAAPLTSFSIGMDIPSAIRAKVEEAREFPVLKIKVGLADDEATIEAVRAVTDKPIRVDANEGWTDKYEAIRMIHWLEGQGIELIEQPMPAHQLEDLRYVRSHVHLPIFADEACTQLTAIPQLREAYDGVNVKLDKAGGPLEAARWIAAARASNLQVMLGCMVSSSCACTAAAQLAGLVDFCDLDGCLLIANDPFRGVEVHRGRLLLPGGPGIGVTLREG